MLIQYQWIFNPVKNKWKRVVKDFDTTKDFSFIATGDNEDYFVYVSGLRAVQKVSQYAILE